jgi:hypothetical protein
MEEILEIVGVVVNMNVWTRIKLAEGAMPGAGHTDISGGPEQVSSLSLAIGLTTTLTTIGLSTEICHSAESLFTREIGRPGRARTRCRCLGVKGPPVQISPARPTRTTSARFRVLRLRTRQSRVGRCGVARSNPAERPS